MARIQGFTTFCAQALVFHGLQPDCWRLTNLARDVIVPVPVK
jgi:hypothetical protein